MINTFVIFFYYSGNIWIATFEWQYITQYSKIYITKYSKILIFSLRKQSIKEWK